MTYSKTITLNNGKTADIIWWIDPSLAGAVSFRVSEIKNPNRKKIGRYRFFDLWHSWAWMDEFESLDDFLAFVEKETNTRQDHERKTYEKIKEFSRNP